MARVLGVIARLKPVPIPGADRTLLTACLEFDTGNLCSMTIAVKRVDDIKRVLLSAGFRSDPTEDELVALHEYMATELEVPQQDMPVMKTTQREAPLLAEAYLRGRIDD